MTAQHTPTPWYVSEEWAATNRYEIISKPQMVPVAFIPHDIYDEGDLGQKDQADANAAFIVRAVNSHDALVGAIEQILDADGDVNVMDFEQLRQALTAAKQTGE